jgi:hypothetical protein
MLQRGTQQHAITVCVNVQDTCDELSCAGTLGHWDNHIILQSPFGSNSRQSYVHDGMSSLLLCPGALV